MPLNTARSPLARAASILGLCLLGASLASCGHGAYTTEHMNTATEKVALIKSGSQWTQAQQQFLAGDLDKALKSVDESIAIKADYAKSHVLRGRILMEKGDLDGSRISLLRAEELDPTLPDTQYYLGILHERFRQPQEALSRYSKAAALDPRSPQYQIASAEMLVQMDRLDDAQALIDSKRDTFQYNPAVKQTEGHIAMLRGNPEAAAKLFGEARLLAPDDMSILEDLARAQIASANWSEAEYNISRVLEGSKTKPAAPGTPALARRDLQHMRVTCLLKLDRPVEARTTLLELTQGQEGEKDLRAWINLGDVCALLNDNARLRTAATRAVAISPETYEGYYLRGLFLHRTGDNKAALDSLDKATTLTATDPGPWVLRGMVQQDLGMLQEAKASFETAAKLAPSDARIRTLMSAVETQ